MKISCLELNYMEPGIGYMQPSVAEIPLRTIFDAGLRPLQKDWDRVVFGNGTADNKQFIAPPSAFRGWNIGRDERIHEHVVGQSFSLIAEALNSGILRPVYGGSLSQLGIANSNGKSSATHLEKHRDTLAALQIYNAQDLKKNKLLYSNFTVGSRLVNVCQLASKELFSGYVLMGYVPYRMTSSECGLVNTAVWIARACHLSKNGYTHRRAIDFFNGSKLERCAEIDHISPKYLDILEEGELCMIHNSALFPPVTFSAWGFIDFDEMFELADEFETNDNDDCFMTCEAISECALLPAFSACRRAEKIDFTNLKEADLSCLGRVYLSGQVYRRLPESLRNADLLVCRRSIPDDIARPSGAATLDMLI